jgi:hypothetical protein
MRDFTIYEDYGYPNEPTTSCRDWLSKLEPTFDERQCIRRAIRDSAITGNRGYGQYCVRRGEAGIMIEGPGAELLLCGKEELDELLANLAWVDDAEARVSEAAVERSH